MDSIKKKFKLTIITATYNRQDTLKKLYKSLLSQTCNDFQWIVVDDGSSDDTKELLQNFSDEKKITIKTIYIENGGKHRAINRAIIEVSTEWSAIVDSDDYLVSTAVEQIILDSEPLHSSDNVALLCYLKCFEDLKIIGDDFSKLDQIDSYIKRIDLSIKGDKFEVFKTDVFKEMLFPEFFGEKFIAESSFWLNIGSLYKAKFVNKALYVCEYLVGGLSDNSLNNRIKCTNGTLHVCKLKYEKCKSFRVRFLSAVNWWRFYFHGKINKQNIVVDKPAAWAKWCFIGGFFVMVWDIIKTGRH